MRGSGVQVPPSAPCPVRPGAVSETILQPSRHERHCDAQQRPISVVSQERSPSMHRSRKALDTPVVVRPGGDGDLPTRTLRQGKKMPPAHWRVCNPAPGARRNGVIPTGPNCNRHWRRVHFLANAHGTGARAAVVDLAHLLRRPAVMAPPRILACRGIPETVRPTPSSSSPPNRHRTRKVPTTSEPSTRPMSEQLRSFPFNILSDTFVV